jgi:hypothetical protein
MSDTYAPCLLCRDWWSRADVLHPVPKLHHLKNRTVFQSAMLHMVSIALAVYTYLLRNNGNLTRPSAIRLEWKRRIRSRDERVKEPEISQSKASGTELWRL